MRVTGGGRTQASCALPIQLCVAHNHQVEVRFSQSARRHRIGKARARHVMDNQDPTRVSDEEAPDRLVWIGPDDRGLELEVVALDLSDYLLVIHVMPTQLRRRRP